MSLCWATHSLFRMRLARQSVVEFTTSLYEALWQSRNDVACFAWGLLSAATAQLEGVRLGDAVSPRLPLGSVALGRPIVNPRLPLGSAALGRHVARPRLSLRPAAASGRPVVSSRLPLNSVALSRRRICCCNCCCCCCSCSCSCCCCSFAGRCCSSCCRRNSDDRRAYGCRGKRARRTVKESPS